MTFSITLVLNWKHFLPDLRIDEVMHNLTLEYIEIEQTCTKHLSKERNSFDDAVKLFDKDTILLSSETNKELLAHFKKVAAISVGRAIAERMKGGGEFLKLLLKNQYKNPTSS